MRIAAMAAGAVGGYFGARMAAAGPRRLLHRARRQSRGHQDQRPQDRERARRSASAKAQRHRRSGRSRPGRYRAVRRKAVGHRNRRRKGAAADRAEHAALITFQNGIDSVERLSRRARRRSRSSAASPISPASSPSPGVIKQTSQFRQDPFRPRRQQARRHAASLRRRRQSRQARHRFVTPTSSASCGRSSSSSRPCPARPRRCVQPIGPIVADPDTASASSAQLMEEAVCRRQGQGRRARPRLYRRAHELRGRPRSSPA